MQETTEGGFLLWNLREDLHPQAFIMQLFYNGPFSGGGGGISRVFGECEQFYPIDSRDSSN